MKIYLVRHGSIDKSNVNNPLEKRMNYQLNEIGIFESNELKKKIQDIKFNACFTSPLIRAWSTAMLLVGDKLEIKSDPRIMERYLGENEGEDIELYDFNSNDNGVETIQDLYTRCRSFLDYLKDNYSDDSRILIVTHYGIIRTIHNIINNKEDEIKVEHCCFREYDI